MSIEAQISHMKTLWPRFRVHHVERGFQAAQWVGVAQPQFTQYTLQIRYRVGAAPQVRILAPALVRLPENPEGQLPHVFPPASDPTLCLYDPDLDQWNWTMAIADTIVPWAFDWIACYEFWLITGRWYGGGRHAGDPLPAVKA